MENPYDEVGGGFGSHVNHRMPKKSCSQWDMLGTSGKNNHLQVGRGLQASSRYKLHHQGVVLLLSLLLVTLVKRQKIRSSDKVGP